MCEGSQPCNSPSFHFFPPLQEQKKSDLESQCPQSHGRIKCAIGIVAAIVLLLAVTQTTLLLVLTYAIPPRTCETKINSSDCAAETETESDNNSVYYQVIKLLRITFPS